MTIKCILFDADGVVINSEMFGNKYQKDYNISNNEMLPFFINEFQDCLTGKKDLIQEIKPWLEKWNWNKSPEEFLSYWFKAEDKLDKNIINSIENLRKNNIKCYLATNQDKYRLEYIKNEMNLNNTFDDIFCSCNIGFKKPDQNYYKFILASLKSKNISSSEILFFDDCQKNIIEAEKLNIKSFLYKEYKDYDKIIKSFL
jgi:HAD superfamily hydrolase (TIGR01509 family)